MRVNGLTLGRSGLGGTGLFGFDIDMFTGGIELKIGDVAGRPTPSIGPHLFFDGLRGLRLLLGGVPAAMWVDWTEQAAPRLEREHAA